MTRRILRVVKENGLEWVTTEVPVEDILKLITGEENVIETEDGLGWKMKFFVVVEP